MDLVENIPKGYVTDIEGNRMPVETAIVLKPLKGGELSLNIEKFGRYDPEVTRYFFIQIVDAMLHMHKKGFCHRDIKPWNIMLNDDMTQAIVIDFGYATPLEEKEFSEAP